MESGTLFNLGRGYAFTVGYYAIPLGVKIGYGWAWFIFAILTLLTFIPIVLLMYKGATWRNHLGIPTFDKYV